MTNRLELNWDADGFIDEQRYYCSETPIDVNNLPVPKAVLGGDIRSYIDTSIEVGKTYYIRVGSVENGVEKISDEVIVVAEKLLVFLPLTTGITDYGSLGLTWNKQGNITHSSDGAYFDDSVTSWIKQTAHDFGSTYKLSIEFKRISGISVYLPLVYFSENIVAGDIGFSSGTSSAWSPLIDKIFLDFSGVSADAASQTISNDAWYKLTVQRSDLNIKIYVNDALGLDINLTQAPNSKAATMLGYAPATTPNKFKGWLKNFKVYDLT